MEKEFEVVDFLDKCRWKKTENYGLINYSRFNLSNSTKLLTHWISYITDRQMAFEQIWDVGGFVFSDMLYEYLKYGIRVLKIGDENSFFFKYDNDNYIFQSHMLIPKDNVVLKKYHKKIEGERATFISRFYPSDYISILYTLNTLERFNRDFVEYIEKLIKCITELEYNEKNLIQGLVYGLYILTYDNIGQPQKDELDDLKWIEQSEIRTDRICKLLKDPNEYKKKVDEFYKANKQYKLKRVWCCLRDYIKSKEFGENCLKKELILRKVNNQVINKIFSNRAKTYLELPGDVWNNNSRFRNCMLTKANIVDEKQSFNKLIREQFESKHIKNGYPEQFDVTFDFVPRMCEKSNCDLCLFNAEYSKTELEKICINNKEKYCTVVLMSCNYKCRCLGDKCKIKERFKK